MLKQIFNIILVLFFSPFILIFTLIFAGLTLLLYKIPPFFLQLRVGKNNQPFTCFKINTMYPPEHPEDINNKEKDKARTTKLGFFMRDHGIDELPQVINILKGHMTFVGPRPLMKTNIQRIIEINQEDTELIAHWLTERSKVLPGLSGWTQAHTLGKSTLKLDLEYLKNPSFGKHLIVFFRSCIIFVIGKNRFFGVSN